MKKNTIKHRLNIIKGQINGLTNLIENEENCRKVATQFYALNSALKKVIELYFAKNLNSCLKYSKKKDKQTIRFLLKEIIKNK